MTKKNLKSLAQLLQGNDDMVHQVYNDIRVKLWTRNRHMRAGETRPFNITMVEDYEYFEGHEIVREKWTRNPMLFQGEYINVHQGKDGNHYATLRKLVLKDGFNAVRIGNVITTELLTAQKVLGL